MSPLSEITSVIGIAEDTRKVLIPKTKQTGWGEWSLRSRWASYSEPLCFFSPLLTFFRYSCPWMITISISK